MPGFLISMMFCLNTEVCVGDQNIAIILHLGAYCR